MDNEGEWLVTTVNESAVKKGWLAFGYPSSPTPWKAVQNPT
jgi:hypothetical protein